MRWQHAICAKIARRRDDAPAEMMLPDAVHHHAGGERIVGLTEPARQAQPAVRFSMSLTGSLSIGRQFRRNAGNLRQARRLHNFQRLHHVAAFENMNSIRRRELSDVDQGSGDGRVLSLKGGQLFDDRFSFPLFLGREKM